MSYEATASDAAIVAQIRELAAGLSDERTRILAQNPPERPGARPAAAPAGDAADGARGRRP
jgi:hypothetical protein